MRIFARCFVSSVLGVYKMLMGVQCVDEMSDMITKSLIGTIL